MFPIFPRGFWVPPMICGLLSTGCIARTAWTAGAFADYQSREYAYYNAESNKQDNNADNNAYSQTPNDNASESKEHHYEEGSSDKEKTAEEKTQIERVAEIMRASTESTIQALSDIFKR